MIVVQGEEVHQKESSVAYSSQPSVDKAQYGYSQHYTNDMLPVEKPAMQSYRDAFWALLFYIHLVTIAIAGATYTPQMMKDVAENYYEGDYGGGDRRLVNSEGTGNSDSTHVIRHLASKTVALFPRILKQEEESENKYGEDNELNMDFDSNMAMIIICLTVVLGFVISSLSMGLLISFGEGLIKCALFFNIAMPLVVAIIGVVGGSPGVVFMSLLFSTFAAYYAWRVWPRIPFAAANLATAVSAVRANIGLTIYAYISIFMLLLWSFIWSLSTMSTLYVTSGCNADGECDNELSGFLVFAFLLSYYWTSQVISNVVTVTTAGTVGTWWFSPQEANGCCSSAVRDSYMRSLTTSFGSICLGSLIVAIVQSIQEMVHQSRENGDSIVVCCAECLLACIASLLEYFNKWAFVYVGLYGFSFMEAGSNVMTLFRQRGWTSIITDYMVDTVLFMVSLAVGILTGILSLIIASAVALGGGGIAFVLGFIVGYAVCATLFSVVSSAVNTVIVCYAEAPNEFQVNHTQLANRMRGAWRQAWPTDFNY